MNDYFLCLNDERLRQLTENELLPPELEELEQHITRCETCRRTLEDASAEPGWPREFRNALNDASDLEFWPGWAAREDLSEESVSLKSVLKLLGPTDDPRMLGRIGAYEIVGILGRGGMGVVFKGSDAALNRYVAIKMLLPHLATSGTARKRFAREAQAAAAVVDDHVMAIHGVSEWQGSPYLVMPYVRGVSLQKRLSDDGPLELREILRIGMQTAAGLAAAHAQGLVHRDVKPANILLGEGVERVTLTDFGLARAVDDASLTSIGVLAGTPQYMSPEQARGQAVDPRSDLFSLGSVLYAICTGRPPFRAESSYGVLRLITDAEPRPIREMNPEIPEWLCAIVASLMAKRPDARYDSAKEVAGLLEHCLAHVQQPATAALPGSLLRPAVAPVSKPRGRFYKGGLIMVATLLMGSVAFLAWPGGERPALPGGADSLYGVWELVLPPSIDQKRPEDQRLSQVFAGDWHATFRGSQRVSASRLKVDPDSVPRRLWLVGNESMRGIYEVKGDGLRLSLAPETAALPTKFGTVHPEFKRVRGSKERGLLEAVRLFSREVAKDNPVEAGADEATPVPGGVVINPLDHLASGAKMGEPGAPAPERPKGDLGRWQGKWRVVRAEYDGKPVTDKDQYIGPKGFSVFGNSFQITNRFVDMDWGEVGYQGKLTLESSRGRSEFLIKMNANHFLNPFMPVHGIYEFHDGKLALCFQDQGFYFPEKQEHDFDDTEQRPNNFLTTPGSGRHLYVLERVKDAEIRKETPGR